MLRSRRTAAPPRVDTAVARFMLGSVAAIAVIVIGGFFALRSVAIDEAEGDTRDRVRAEGRLVEAAGLRDAIVRGDPAAIRLLDDLVQAQILGGPIVRVKLWTKRGVILYSDEPALIGRRYPLGDDELAPFRGGGADADLSDLAKPEHRYERSQGKQTTTASSATASAGSSPHSRTSSWSRSWRTARRPSSAVRC